MRNGVVSLEPANKDNVQLLMNWKLDPIAQGLYKKVPNMTPDELEDLFLQSPDRWYFLIKSAIDHRPLGRFYYRAWRFQEDPRQIDWELNLLIAEPRERGKGYGTAVQMLASGILLRLPETHTVFAYTFFNNLGERRALEKAGFEYAGYLPSEYYRVASPPEEWVLYIRRKTGVYIDQ